MDYKEFFEKMQQGRAVSADWRNTLKLLDTLLKGEGDKEQYLKLFILLFSLTDDGNVYMYLDENRLNDRFSAKLSALKAEVRENDAQQDALYDELTDEIRKTAPYAVGMDRLPVTGDGTDKLFVVSEGKLFTRRNYNAVMRINESVERLFTAQPPRHSAFAYKTAVIPGFALSAGQEEILGKGFYDNLLVTGGPGTGKTTSVFFLLLSLLLADPDCNVYLTAPSGKAASRMKDSILGSADKLMPAFAAANSAVIERIKNLDEYTIHRLLSYSPADNSFQFHRENRFAPKSIFVIDEASMIDVTIFAALLDAIPDGARVFMLGDKNQLPSVECGAVFGALLDRPALQNNTVRLTESKRFDKDTEIFKLSETINAGGDLGYIRDVWQPWQDFSITEASAGTTPIHYYRDDAKRDIEMIDTMAQKWYKTFYEKTSLQDVCVGLEESMNADGEADCSAFDEIWRISENARILCACNESARGVQHINRVLRKAFYAGKSGVSGFYPGELLMITRNNKALDIYNGDCGVTVQFQGDDTLYLMLKKGTNLRLDSHKVENRIFKLGDYLFYPVRLISSEDISSAFAISIHKSQGSDYKNIFVILPKTKGHPLLNRQIIYTAITRTKGTTYILSHQENLECARDTVLVRDTF